MPIIEILLDSLAQLIVGNGNETANVIRIIVHNPTVNFKNVHVLLPVEAIAWTRDRQSALSSTT